MAGKVALAVAANYPAPTNDLDAATPAYVAAAIAAIDPLDCVGILEALNYTADICTDGTRGGMLFSSSVAADIAAGDGGGGTIVNPWVYGNLTMSGGGLQAAAPTVHGELRQLLASATRTGPEVPSWLIAWAGDPINMAVGPITYNSNNVPTSFNVQWPDGGTGVYTATTLSTLFPGSTDAYTVTYVGAGTTQAWSGITRTVTQPLVTRDAFGRTTDRPLRTVA